MFGFTPFYGIFPKIQLFVPAKSDHDPDPDWFCWIWIRIRIEVKTRSGYGPNADPKHSPQWRKHLVRGRVKWVICRIRILKNWSITTFFHKTTKYDKKARTCGWSGAWSDPRVSGCRDASPSCTRTAASLNRILAAHRHIEQHLWADYLLLTHRYKEQHLWADYLLLADTQTDRGNRLSFIAETSEILVERKLSVLELGAIETKLSFSLQKSPEHKKTMSIPVYWTWWKT